MSRLRDQTWRLRPTSYPFVISMRTAFGDMDSFRHLNNVALARMFEEGRISMNMELVGVDNFVRPDESLQLLQANMVIDYVEQGKYPGDVIVANAITRIGRSSIHEASAIFQSGRCVALGEAVLVHTEYGKSTPFTPALRARLERFLVDMGP